MTTGLRVRRSWVVAAAAAIAGAVAVAPSAEAERPLTAHERVVAFWTNERVARAIPRDIVRPPTAGPISPMAKGSKGGSGGTSVVGASWTGGGMVTRATGKVLFAIGSDYFVCSASVVNDGGVSNASVILTAGHCVFEYGVGDGYATNWIFVPDYDAAPAPLDRNRLFCANTAYGCWVAERIIVSSNYATTPGFPVNFDYAFVRVGLGGKDGSTELDKLSTATGHGIQFSASSNTTDTWLFGYPAAGPYNGTDLVYSRGPLGRDPYNGNQTYKVSSNMTGGSSGGPWFVAFSDVLGSGTLMSVNSYGYSGVKAMHGPILNAQTSRMFAEAKKSGSNAAVS